jgi:dTDP-glucose 4,6-dehydratase
MNSKNTNGEVINLGSNYEISIKDTVDLIAKMMGENISISSDKERLRPEKSEVERLWSDNSKAKEIIQWTPKYGGLDGFERGIKETINWFLLNKNRHNFDAQKYTI